MTKHPGKTPVQRRILDAIGCGNNSPLMAKATREAMLKVGLIQKCGQKKFGNGPFAVIVDEFDMPIPVHMQWCQYQSEIYSKGEKANG